MSRIGVRLLIIVLAGATIGCDRVTKHLATTVLAGTPPRSFFAGAVRLEYAENTGGFLGLGAALPVAARTALFTIGTGLALLAMTAIVVQLRKRPWPLVGLTLFIAGGASNWTDRLLNGRVTDFLVVGWGPVRTGIFNVADVAVMLGAGLFILTRFSIRVEQGSSY